MKKVLLRIGIVVAGLLVIAGAYFGAKYYKLCNDTKYNPVSIADFIYNAFPKRPKETVAQYIRTVSETPLGDDLTVRKSEVIRSHERHTAYYIGVDSFFGRYYQCVETDYGGAMYAINQLGTDTEGAYPEYYLSIVEQPESTVVFIATRYPLSDTVQGEPALCLAPDEAALFAVEDGMLQFFVLPPVNELPDDYMISCKYFTIFKRNLQHLLEGSVDSTAWKGVEQEETRPFPGMPRRPRSFKLPMVSASR